MITLVLAFHNHQPVGNFGWVFEDAYQRAYRPLMEVMAGFPSIRFGQHYTGILLDWFAENHPEFLEVVERSVRGGRVELLSGGYYEPILAMLPERDRREQIVKLNRRIEERFGAAPTGMWLAERVWEPSLPSTLHEAGIRYTFLDDTHFKSAGLAERELTGYFLTEDQGRPLAVFPIDKKLRYTMPFEDPEVTFEYLASLDRDGTDRVVTFADDGEKFGIWPETYRTVYDQKWLERFCLLLERNASWVRTELPGRVVATRAPASRIYLPTASYAEMLHWALPTVKGYLDYETFEKILKEEAILDRFEGFVRGGFWRNFQVKYPEVNGMQKKMLRVSNRLDRLRRGETPGGAGDRRHLESAAEHLMAGQCNCPYWHGVFGGIYLANIRMAMYRELIAAEREMDRYEGLRGAHVSVEDYDIDGAEEIIVETPTMAFYLAPERGAGIFEFDYKPVGYNFCDVLQRRKEGYHAQLARLPKSSVAEEAPATAEEPVSGTVADAPPTSGSATDGASAPAGAPAGTATSQRTTTDDGSSVGSHGPVDAADAGAGTGAKSIHEIVRVKEPGLEKALVYDRYRHAMLLDHFYGADLDAVSLRDATVTERGDFHTGRYDHLIERADDGTLRLTLERRGTVDGTQPVLVRKRISLGDGPAVLTVDYLLRSLDGSPLRGRFGVELTSSLSAGTEPDRYYLIDGVRPPENDGRPNGTGASAGRAIALVDEWLGAELLFELERPAMLLRAPIETVSLSEEGFEKNYQGSIVLAAWELEGVSEWRISLTQEVRPRAVA